jgi:hypothetical protein
MPSASGDGLTLVETFDGGASWRDVDLPGSSTDPLYNVAGVGIGACE